MKSWKKVWSTRNIELALMVQKPTENILFKLNEIKPKLIPIKKISLFLTIRAPLLKTEKKKPEHIFF